MEERFMIDFLADDVKVKERVAKGNVNYKFINILEYVKEKYEVYIVDLAKFLNITRPTIYNYFSKNTNELPSKILNRMSYVYGVKTFEEVIRLEKEVEDAYFEDKPFVDQVASGELTIDGVQFNDFEEKYLRYYVLEPVYHSPDATYFNVQLKRKYDFKLLWKHAIHEMDAQALGMKSIKFDNVESEMIEKIIQNLVNLSSVDYVETLLRVLRKKVEKEDLKFINYIDEY